MAYVSRKLLDDTYGTAAAFIDPSTASNTSSWTTKIDWPLEFAKAEMKIAEIDKTTTNDPLTLSMQNTSMYFQVSCTAGMV